MFYNLKPLIAKALLSNGAIMNYIAKTEHGHPVLGSNKLVAGLFPAMEFHSIGGTDRRSVDDKVDLREYRFQFTIFTQDSSHYLIENEVDKEMRELGFHCYFDHELYDSDLNVTSRVLLYQVYLDSSRYNHIKTKFPLEPQEHLELNNL